MTGNSAAIADACEAAGQMLAHLRRERDQIACEGGPEAVAAWVSPAGSSEDRARIAARYAELQRQVQAPTAAAV